MLIVGVEKRVDFYALLLMWQMYRVQFNPVYEVVVSVDKMAMLEYWTGPKTEYAFPKSVDWEYKTDTDLYEFAKVANVLPFLFSTNVFSMSDLIC
jgi:hypothetical protein